MVLIAVCVVIFWNNRAQRVQTDLRMTESIQQNAQEIAYLTNAYLLFQYPSQLELLRLKTNAVSDNLSRFKAESALEQSLVDEANANQKRFLAVLSDIQSYVDANPSALNDLAYVRTLWSRMQAQSQAMVTDIIRLHFLIHEKSDRLRQTNNLMMLGLFLIFGIGIYINALLINRRILGSLAKVIVGPQIVGSGNLDYVIPVSGNDEFADLSRAFNRMTENLKNVIASKAELEAAHRKLAEAERQLRMYANAASHDLKEPLRMVTSFSQMLEKHYKDKLGADADEYIGYIVSNAARMERLIDDLLAYSRAGHDGQFEDVNMETVFREIMERLKNEVKETGAIVTHDPLPVIRADGTLIARALQHLIDNAIKFHGEQTPQIHVSAWKDEEKHEWAFSVKDNGIGIDPKFSSRLFVLFQQLQARGKYPGTGTGLAIVKKIIESHGGQVYVDSQPDKGSTFTFTLPVNPGGTRNAG
ncbi:MAG: ATP-binding protein [Dehalococcoidales bacterium]|nr:ATP-binding protein [Dehalococcoidales bacterium]